MPTFQAASHHDIQMLLVQVAVLLMTAKLLGQVARWLGQPSVVGEILSGILLGPSLLSGILPIANDWIVPHTEVQGYLLELVALLGAMFLLVVTGLETDLGLIRRHARTAIATSAGGLGVNLGLGFVLGMLLPDFLLGESAERIVFSLFVATSMAISAIPVIAKILMDLNLMRRNIGQTIIAAGMMDDTTGWILLGFVISLAGGQAVTAGAVGVGVGRVLLFMFFSFTVGAWLVRHSLNFVQDRFTDVDRGLSLVVVWMFVWAALTNALNLEPVLGAFVLGILFGQMPRLSEDVRHRLESIALGVFAPIFFAVAGLKVNVLSLLDPRVGGLALLVIAVASTGKLVGCYAGARIIGRRDHWTALSFGAGLNARGAMEIIVASIGLSLGILSQEMFSIIVVMAMVTSLMAPPALRWALRHVPPDEEELERLRGEQLAEASVVGAIHRVLVPIRPHGPQTPTVQTIEAGLLERLAEGQQVTVTLLSVVQPGERAAALEFLTSLRPLFGIADVTPKVIETESVADAVLDEARKDYQLLVIGASRDGRSPDIVFGTVVDYIVRMSPCPTLVVHAETIPEDWEPRRLLVPVTTSRASRDAADVAFSLARTEGDRVTLLNVVVSQSSDHHLDPSGHAYDRRMRVGHELVNELSEVGEVQRVPVSSYVRVGPSVEQGVLDVAQRHGADLLILGTDVRPGTQRLFLGPRIERILREAPCPVAVINAPTPRAPSR